MRSTPVSTAAQASEQLRRFTAGLPGERDSLLRFALRVAAELPPGCRLIDVGAGNSPYRELFDHVHYESADWEHSVHLGARMVDHVGPAHDLPVPDNCYDAVLCTQVLEHVPNPDAVIRELHRILRPGGRLYLTVPLAWELHEMPFDFYRYTPHGLASILSGAGFVHLDIRPRNDCFTTLAQLLENVGSAMGRYPDDLGPRRAEALSALRAMAAALASYADLDARKIFPLGYSVVALRPTGPKSLRPSGDRAAAGLTGARGFVTLCFAADVFAEPSMLAAYGKRFSAADDATLLIYVPNSNPGLAGSALTQLVADLGLEGPQSADMLALPYRERAPDEKVLAAAVDAVLSLRPPWGPFTDVPWAHAGTMDTLYRLALEKRSSPTPVRQAQASTAEPFTGGAPARTEDCAKQGRNPQFI
jgi:SAM-dependent methyltransferase